MKSINKSVKFSFLLILLYVATVQVEGQDEEMTSTKKADTEAGNETTDPQPMSLSEMPSSTTSTTPASTTSSEKPEEKPFLDCLMIQECQTEKDENTAQVVGILERKLVKLEKDNKMLKETLDTLMTKLDSCSCGENMDKNQTTPEDPNARPKEESPSSRIQDPEKSMNDTSSPEDPAMSSNETYFPLQTLGPNPRCFDGGSGPGPILIKRCNPSDPKQNWKFKNGALVNKANSLCLDGAVGDFGVQAADCIEGKPSQRWNLLPDNTITNAGSTFCLTTGAYWALSSECDGEAWQQYDYWRRLQTPQYYLVTFHF